MGYGEFDGGGSMKWMVEHTEGANGQGNANGASGWDNHPRVDNNGGQPNVMAVWIQEAGSSTFTKHGPFVCKDSKVVVAWGARALPPNPPPPKP